jgi:hypothetical protein
MEFVTNGWRQTISRHCHLADPGAISAASSRTSRFYKREGTRVRLTRLAEETKLPR